MYFFKFQKPGNLEFSMLRRGEIFFASVAELNDANECRPRLILRGSEELWIRLAGYFLVRGCLAFEGLEPRPSDRIRGLLSLDESVGQQLKKRAGSSDFALEDLEEIFLEILEHELLSTFSDHDKRNVLKKVRIAISAELPKDLERVVYITSFSESAKNATMWGHYAAAEKGFVIVYSTANKSVSVRSPVSMLHGARDVGKPGTPVTELGIYNEDTLPLHTVTYGRKPPKVNAFHRLIPKFAYSEEEDHYDVPLLIGGDAPTKQEDQVGLVKFSDWKYEKEVRAFLPVHSQLPPDARIMNVDSSQVKGVIFGPRMTIEDKHRTILCCHFLRTTSIGIDSQPPFVFFQARQVVDRFEFDIAAAAILAGKYHGDSLPLQGIAQAGKENRSLIKAMEEQINDV